MSNHNQTKNSKAFFWITLVLCFVTLLISSGFCLYNPASETQEDAVTATVLEVLDTQVSEVMEGFENTEVRL